jgi:NAD+ synthase (glutamine-hydrolysing)
MKGEPVRVALLQLNPVVGDLDGNVALLRAAYADAVRDGARIVCATELAIPGYPPEDLLLKRAFVEAGERALHDLAGTVGGVPLVVGFVERLEGVDPELWRPVASEASGHPPIANAAAVLRDGAVEAVYRKHRLPNYGVFDEARYFQAGTRTTLFYVDGVAVGVTICEDMWGDGGPLLETAQRGAQLILNLNASPYSRGKRHERERWASHHARRGEVWVAYAAQVGGQDEVVFDGDSFLVAPSGEIVARGAQFAEDRLVVDLPLGSGPGEPLPRPFPPRLDPVAEVYAALVLGTGDYVRKNGFTAALLGVSGGIDSALTAAVAADALGAEHITGVAMPSPYSSPGSLADAKSLAANLGIGWLELPIASIMEAFRATLAEPFAGTAEGIAEENIQSRIRGTLLMALSNKRGDIVLATGNKSEYAVGYSTLYGDMAGGFAVLKDVPKTLVYELARWRNREGEVIPQASLDKPPSAELRPDQRDSDSLLPYDVLDPILAADVEQDRAPADLVAEGYDEGDVRTVFRMVDRAEYKRRQAAPGVKITPRAFGKDRRVPITQRWSG